MFARLLVCFIATVVVFTSSINSADDFPGMPFVDNPGSDMSEYSGSMPFVPSGESSSEQVQPPPSQTEDTVFKPVATDSVYWRRLPWVPKLTSDGSVRFWPYPGAPIFPFPPCRPPRVVPQPPKRTPPSTKLWLFPNPPIMRPSPHTRPHRPPPPPPSARPPLPPVWTPPPPVWTLPPPLAVQPPIEPPVPIDPPIPTEPPAPAPQPPLVNPPEGYPTVHPLNS